MNKISYKNELLRKSIHLSSSILSLIIYLYGKNFVIYPMIFLTISYVLLDYLRKKNDINNFYLKYFKIVSRENEIKGSLTGASYLLIGYTTTILLYDETAVIISILIVSLSDSVSAIVGRKYGYIKIRNKTLEGTMSFLLCSIFIFLPFGYNYINIFILSIIITLVEFFDDILIDDNLSLPIISGFLISLILI